MLSRSALHGILQARLRKWVVMPSSGGFFQPRDWTQVSCIPGGVLYHLSHQGSPRILGVGSLSLLQGSSWPRNPTGVSCIASGFFTSSATRELLIGYTPKQNWRRKWQPTPVFLPGESQRWRGPGGLPSMGLHRVRHDWSDLAAAKQKEKLKKNKGWISNSRLTRNQREIKSDNTVILLFYNVSWGDATTLSHSQGSKQWYKMCLKPNESMCAKSFHWL